MVRGEISRESACSFQRILYIRPSARIWTETVFTSIKQKHASLKKLAALLYKVPVDQWRANPEAYTPFLFSFGPYHAFARDGHHAAAGGCSRADQLVDGDYLKRLIADALLRHAPDQLTALVDKIDAELETQIRHLYVQYSWELHEQLDLRLANILALDAITIIAATLSPKRRMKTPLISYPLSRLALTDVILLENQVPILLLNTALQALQLADQAVADREISSPESESESDPLPSCVEDVIIWYCERATPFPEYCAFSPAGMRPLDDITKRESILAFLYQILSEGLTVPSSILARLLHGQHLMTTNLDDPVVPTASRLARCGLKFQASPTAHANFDINKAVLFLPKISVNDTTVRVLHNLLAYEATVRHPHQYAIVSYVHFMDCLIDTASDVQVLADAGVICNKLGSHEELASMWNKLCVAVSYRNTISDKVIMAQLETLSKRRWHRWKASFKELYWERQPWLLLSIVVAIVLFVLALLQTIFTILG